MRRGLMLGTGVGLLNGALAVALAWWLGRPSNEFGWYSYRPMPRRYADYLSTATFVDPTHARPAWEVTLVLLGAFVVVNALAAAAWLLLRRRRAA